MSLRRPLVNVLPGGGVGGQLTRSGWDGDRRGGDEGYLDTFCWLDDGSYPNAGLCWTSIASQERGSPYPPDRDASSGTSPFAEGHRDGTMRHRGRRSVGGNAGTRSDAEVKVMKKSMYGFMAGLMVVLAMLAIYAPAGATEDGFVQVDEGHAVRVENWWRDGESGGFTSRERWLIPLSPDGVRHPGNSLLPSIASQTTQLVMLPERPSVYSKPRCLVTCGARKRGVLPVLVRTVTHQRSPAVCGLMELVYHGIQVLLKH